MKSNFQEVLKKIDTSKAETIYGLSDGHIYINPDPAFIQKIASSSDLEIITLKGKELEKIAKVTKSKENDATTGS